MKQTLLLTTTLTLLFSSLDTTSHAQKCKYVGEQVDPFTKQGIYNFRHVIGPLLGGWTFILRQEGARCFVGVGMQNGKGMTEKLKKGAKISFLLEDESTIEIVTKKEYESIPDEEAAPGYTQWFVLEEVSKATFAKFGTSPIKALKTAFQLKGNNQEFLLPGIMKKQAKRIMAAAACMAGN